MVAFPIIFFVVAIIGYFGLTVELSESSANIQEDFNKLFIA